MSRKIKILFTLSVLLNVVLIGLMIGGASRMYHHFGHSNEFKKELESMSPEVRERIEAAYEKSRQEMRELFIAARHAKQEVRETLNADEFDPQDFEVAIGQLNQLRFRMLQTQAKKTGMIAAELSAEERRKFAGHLLRGARKGGFFNYDKPPGKQSFAPAPTQQEDQAPAPIATSNGSRKVQNEPFDPVMLPMPDY